MLSESKYLADFLWDFWTRNPKPCWSLYIVLPYYMIEKSYRDSLIEQSDRNAQITVVFIAISEKKERSMKVNNLFSLVFDSNWVGIFVKLKLKPPFKNPGFATELEFLTCLTRWKRPLPKQHKSLLPVLSLTLKLLSLLLCYLNHFLTQQAQNNIFGVFYMIRFW